MKPHLLRLRPALAASALLAAAVPSRADVWTVAPSGGDFTNIPHAVSAAADGDTILVRDGTYLIFAIVGKSLRVIADGDAVFVDGYNNYGPGSFCFRVRDLGPGQEVLVRGLRMNYGASVSNCAGTVWLDDLLCTGGAGHCTSGGAPGMEVTGSSSVTFTRCAFVGESGNPESSTSPSASVGARVTSSTVQLYDCWTTGGDGTSRLPWVEPGQGGAGLELDASTVTLVGCTIEGGGGGLDTTNVCGGVHAPGGAGLSFAGGPSTLRSAASTAAGGVTSLEPMCPGQTGPRGPALSGTGTIVPLPGFARHLRANGPVRPGETLTFDVEGVAGEVPLLFVSAVHEPLPMLAYSGILLVGLPPSDVFVLDPLPASGRASLSFPAPLLAPGVQSAVHYAQAVFLDPTPRVWLGAATTVVLLGPGL